MDPFRLMLAGTVWLLIAAGLFAVTRALVKRFRTSSPPSVNELEEIRTRMELLEAREAQVEELEERLDFLERVLPAIREGKPLSIPPPRRQTTPV